MFYVCDFCILSTTTSTTHDPEDMARIGDFHCFFFLEVLGLW